MNFITESEVEEAKTKRAEEWQKAREAGREIPEEEPELIRDNRPLYEKLQEQKDQKQEEFEEQLKFKNMIYKGLNEEDAKFLSDVAQKQAQMDGKRFEDETGEIAQFRAAAEKVNSEKIEDGDDGEDVPKIKIASEYTVNRKSQAAMLASSIIRKRKSSVDPKSPEETGVLVEKQRRTSSEENPSEKSKIISNAEAKEVIISSSLSLLADYPSSSSEEESS